MRRLSPQEPFDSLNPPLPKPPDHTPSALLQAGWKFSRPHTIIGTTLSCLGLYGVAIALLQAVPPPSALLLALVACLCGNVYIVGLNQLTDIDIDRINKPQLPLASGAFSRRQGQVIVGISGLLALGLSLVGSPALMATVWLSLAIGTAYSLPPLRLKRFPLWASLCIFTVRGVIVNLGLYLHYQQTLGLEGLQIPAAVWALTLFVLVFTTAIALFKDIPDLEGDRRFHITTFALQLGQRTVFNVAQWLITASYAGLILAAPALDGVNAAALIVTHGLALVLLWWQTRSVDLSDRRAIARCYQFIWKLFFLEYLVFPAACLLSRLGA